MRRREEEQNYHVSERLVFRHSSTHILRSHLRAPPAGRPILLRKEIYALVSRPMEEAADEVLAAPPPAAPPPLPPSNSTPCIDDDALDSVLHAETRLGPEMRRDASSEKKGTSGQTSERIRVPCRTEMAPFRPERSAERARSMRCREARASKATAGRRTLERWAKAVCEASLISRALSREQAVRTRGSA